MSQRTTPGRRATPRGYKSGETTQWRRLHPWVTLLAPGLFVLVILRWYSLCVTRAFLVPLEILLASRVEGNGCSAIDIGDPINGCPTPPLMNLGMSVGKGKSASTVMVRARRVVPLRRIGVDDERTVI